MRFVILALPVLLAVAMSVRADDAKDVTDTWMATEGTNAGNAFPKELLDTISLTISDGGTKYKVSVMGKDDLGTVKADATKTPKTMEITGTEGPNKGRTMLAIYELNGDTMKVCYDLAGKTYPTKFESTKDNGFVLFVYKRKK